MLYRRPLRPRKPEERRQALSVRAPVISVTQTQVDSRNVHTSRAVLDIRLCPSEAISRIGLVLVLGRNTDRRQPGSGTVTVQPFFPISTVARPAEQYKYCIRAPVLKVPTRESVRTRDGAYNKSHDLVNKDLIRTVMRCFELRLLAPMRAARPRSKTADLSRAPTCMPFASTLSS